MGKPIDERSDLFSLGVVLYEWITGYKLFTGENEMAILKSIIDGRIYPPSYFRDDIPQGIEEILMKALAKDRDERYQTAREMLFDVQQWLNGSEFTPTPSHLANFMKQIFADEIDRERAALVEAAEERQKKTPPPLPGNGAAPSDARLGEAVGKAKDEVAPSGAELIVVETANEHPAPHGGQDLTLNLANEEYERLRLAAERSGVPIQEMVKDILRGTLKYL
jgi:serine/threonine-protein kinase